jgi:hypothetical protein
VELDDMCSKKRGEHRVGIERATKVPEMMIHTIMKSERKKKQMLLTCQTTRRLKLHARGDGGLGERLAM